MLIQPSDGWRWEYSETLDRVVLKTSINKQFTTHINQKLLMPGLFEQQVEFSIHDASLFYLFWESSNPLSLSESDQLTLVLNSILSSQYLKPMMPTSWFFKNFEEEYQPQVGELIWVECEESGQEIPLIVNEISSPTASVCSFALNQIELGHKTYAIGYPIKIMNNRIKAPHQHNQDEVLLSLTSSY